MSLLRFMTVLARTCHCPSVKRSEHMTATFTVLLRSILRLFLFPLQGLPIVLFHSGFFLRTFCIHLCSVRFVPRDPPMTSSSIR